MSLDHPELTRRRYGYVAGTQKSYPFKFPMPMHHTYMQVCPPVSFTICECLVQVSGASKRLREPAPLKSSTKVNFMRTSAPGNRCGASISGVGC